MCNNVYATVGVWRNLWTTVEHVRFRDSAPIQKNQQNSHDFVTNRPFMKLFRTTDIRICQELFNVELPSVLLERRCKKFRESIFCMVFCLVKFAFKLRLLFYYCYYHIDGEHKDLLNI